MNQTVFPPVLIGDPDLTACVFAAKQTSWRSKLKSFFKQAITYTVLASLQLGTLVQTKEAYAQYVQYGGQPTNGQPNTGYVAPVAGAISGYTNDGTLFMGGQRIGNPHQILHDAQIPSFMNITATRYTFTNDPTHGQGTLAQMELATTNGSDSSVLLNRLYLSPTNPYTGLAPGPYPNLQTYAGVLTNAQQANYLLTNADDGKTYAFKTLTAANRQAVDLLIRELPNTSQFKAAADPLGGGTGVRVTQNGDAVALAAYLATVKPYDYSWQPNFGTTFGQNGGQNPYGGWANSNNFAPDYSEGAGPAQSFQAFIKQLQDDAVANDKRVRSQTSANSLDLSGVNPNSLFGEGHNLFSYGSNSNPNRDLENDFLRRLQSGQLTAGSADYLEASRIAQERYRIAYATRLETGKPLQYSVADAQRKANELKLNDVNPNELFGQGFDLFQFNKALRANGDAENVLLARLQNGELTPGSSEYAQATQIAQERLRQAYSLSLSPPPPKSIPKWKQIAGLVVGAVLTFVTAGLAAPFIGAALGVGATVASAIAGVVGGYVGAVVSTGITTGSMSQALRAGEKALVSGSIKAIVASAIGAGFISDIIGGTIATKVVNGGSIEDAFKGAVIGAAVTFVADGIGEKFAGAIKDANLGDVGTELAHGALGCVTGMIRSQSGSGCVPGAAGAVAGHLLAPVIFNTGFDPLGTGTVQGIKDSAVFFSGVVGGAVAAAVGKDDQVSTNYGLGSAAGSNAALNNALSNVKNKTAVSDVVGEPARQLEKDFELGKITAAQYLAAINNLSALAAKIDAAIIISNNNGKIPLAEMMGKLTPSQLATVSEAIGGLLYVPGAIDSAYQLLTGKTATGEEANYFFAALGILPGAGMVKGLDSLADITKALGSVENVTAATRIAANQAKGADFEKAVLTYLGEAKNTEAFTVKVGEKAVTFIPDGLVGGDKLLEIKNVAYLTNSPQLRAYAEAERLGVATAGGLKLQPIELVVNPNTKISKPLLAMIEQRGGSVKVFDPVSKTMRPY